MSKRRYLSPEEKNLWDGFMRGVKRLIESEKPVKSDLNPKPTLPKKEPRTEPIDQLIPPVINGQLLTRQRFTRIRKMLLEGRIDLHGSTRDQAYFRLHRFLEKSHQQGKTWVLVITGKGTPQRPSIIRRSVPEWLNSVPLRDMVAEFAIAKPQDGGEGALYVRLKKLSK